MCEKHKQKFNTKFDITMWKNIISALMIIPTITITTTTINNNRPFSWITQNLIYVGLCFLRRFGYWYPGVSSAKHSAHCIQEKILLVQLAWPGTKPGSSVANLDSCLVKGRLCCGRDSDRVSWGWQSGDFSSRHQYLVLFVLSFFFFNDLIIS